MLPDTSQGSPMKGIWFVHNDGINTIRFFGSNTGKEKVFLNEELVSEQRSVKLKSAHEFQDKDGNTYEIELSTTSILKGEMECIFYKNTVLTKSFNTSFRRGNNFTIKRFSILLILVVAFTVISGQLDFPDYAFYIFLFLMIIVHVFTRNPDEIIIVEDEKNDE